MNYQSIYDLVNLLPAMYFPAWWLVPAFGLAGLICFELRMEVLHR